MRAHLSRRYHFSAAHRLHSDALTPEQNQATYGKCNNPYGHGHDYTVQVTFAGPVDPTTGMVTSLTDLDAYATEHLFTPFDHTNLNTLPIFAGIVPTTENLTLALHKLFSTYPHAHLTGLHVEETPNNAFDYPATLLKPSAL